MSKWTEAIEQDRRGRPEPEKKRGVLSIDEVMELISDIATEGEGADRFRALKMLAGMNAASAALPDPLPEVDLIDRLARLMKSAGRDLSQVAYKRAFPAARATIDQKLEATLEDLDPEILAQAKRIRSLKHLYRMFPEIKRPGVPPGYPMGRGIEIQQEWLRRKSVQILMDRKKVDMEEAARLRKQREDELLGDTDGPSAPEPSDPLPEVPGGAEATGS